MAADKNRMNGKKEPKELYLKIPYQILNITGLGLREKVLLAHIYSFGEKGCWQSNATLGEIFMVCPRTISLWIAKLARSNLIQTKSPKGYYRTIWAKSHPKVSEASAVLTERKSATVRSIEEFKKQFGIGKRSHQPLSEKEINDRR